MEKFSLEMNQTDRDLLEEVAGELGFESGRDMIDKLLREFATDNEQCIECAKKKPKFKNIYDIPQETQAFYEKLACAHSTTISSVIYRYIIFPKISTFLIEKAKNRETKQSKA